MGQLGKKRGSYFSRGELPKTSFRLVTETYWFLLERFPEEIWEDLSYRKQVCLSYLRWLVHPENKEYKDTLIKKVKEWRKKEPNRFGSKRSRLETICRKLFRKHAKDKTQEKCKEAKSTGPRKQIESGTGGHSPELVKKRSTSEWGKHMRSLVKHHSSTCHWVVYSPTEEVFEVFGLSEFCKERGLNLAHLSQTAKVPGKLHKGWRARKRNIEIEGFTPGFEPHTKGG
jgi:hypothetical protein